MQDGSGRTGSKADVGSYTDECGGVRREVTSLVRDVDDDAFALQLLFFASDADFRRIAQSAFEMSPDERTGLAQVAEAMAGRPRAPEPRRERLRLVSDRDA